MRRRTIKTTVTVATLVLAAGAASAQCLGDFNNDLVVTVDEVITSVSNALNGCSQPVVTPNPTPASTPTATPEISSDDCPFDFSENVPEGDFCVYEGVLNSACPLRAKAMFSTLADGTVSAFVLFGDILDIDREGNFFMSGPARRSNFSAVRYWSLANSPTNIRFISGSISLWRGVISVAPADTFLTINGCDVNGFVGVYLGTARELASMRGNGRASTAEDSISATLEWMRTVAAESAADAQRSEDSF